MAYGKEQLRPQRGKENIKPPKVFPAQKGKTGMEGASEEAYPKFGGMPASGNFEPSAGGQKATNNKATKGSGGHDAKQGAAVVHKPTKEMLKPASKGGSSVGSIDTMTKLIFHPKGGMGGGTTARRSASAPGFKDSGKKGSPKVSSGVCC